MNKPLTIMSDEGLEVEIPSKFEVCPRCDGNGVHDHPAFANGITSDDWNGPDWDDDSREGCMSGRYNVPCEQCGGERVVPVPDWGRMTEEHRRLIDEHDRDMADLRACERSERILCGEG